MARLETDDDPNAYLNRVLDRCAQWFRAAGGSIFLVDADGVCRLACKTGTLSRMPDESIIDERSTIAWQAMERMTPLLVDETTSIVFNDLKLARKSEIGSAMVVPLMTREGVIGVINLSRNKTQPAFQHEDLAQSQAIARHLALAVGNARLFASNRRLLQEQTQLKERLESVIDRMGVGVFVTNPDGSLGEVNPQGRFIFDTVPSPGAPTAVWMKSVKPDFRKAVARMVTASRCSKNRQVRASERTWSFQSSPMQSGGVVLTVEDVTQLEQQLNEQNHLMRLAEIGQMTAAIAHEIRNPLTGIKSAAQMIGESPEKASEFAIIISEEADQLNMLCNDFLDFAKPLQLRLEPVKLWEVANRVVTRLMSQFKSQGVDLELGLDPSGQTIQADRNRLEQVLTNLLLNALQASQPATTVRVTAASGKLVVEDQGAGMNPETISQLFTPFFTTKAKGTGLGMSNVRKIIEAHKGRITVRSEPGAGTQFEVRLNARAA